MARGSAPRPGRPAGSGSGGPSARCRRSPASAAPRRDRREPGRRIVAPREPGDLQHEAQLGRPVRCVAAPPRRGCPPSGDGSTVRPRRPCADHQIPAFRGDLRPRPRASGAAGRRAPRQAPASRGAVPPPALGRVGAEQHGHGRQARPAGELKVGTAPLGVEAQRVDDGGQAAPQPRPRRSGPAGRTRRPTRRDHARRCRRRRAAGRTQTISRRPVASGRPGRLARTGRSDQHDQGGIRDRESRLCDFWLHGHQRGRTAAWSPANHRPLAAGATGRCVTQGEPRVDRQHGERGLADTGLARAPERWRRSGRGTGS